MNYAHQQEAQAKRDEEDVEVLRKRRLAEGTPVTAETFARWRAAFELELAQSKKVEKVHTKLTGKQMFLQHLARDVDEDAHADTEEGDLIDPEAEEQLFLNEEAGLSDEDDLSDED